MTNISIAPENAQKILAIFQRLHTRAEYPANGIGLSIGKKIVEQNGGTIWMEPLQRRLRPLDSLGQTPSSTIGNYWFNAAFIVRQEGM